MEVFDMKQITQEEIEEAAIHHVESRISYGDKDTLRGWAFEAGAEWAISQMQPEWVAITDQLPNCGESILCYSPKGGVNIHYFSLMYADCDLSEWQDRTTITHWMPLPQPPTK